MKRSRIPPNLCSIRCSYKPTLRDMLFFFIFFLFHMCFYIWKIKRGQTAKLPTYLWGATYVLRYKSSPPDTNWTKFYYHRGQGKRNLKKNPVHDVTAYWDFINRCFSRTKVMHRTRSGTGVQKDRQSDMGISIYPKSLLAGYDTHKYCCL